jgi:hypothetical protein
MDLLLSSVEAPVVTSPLSSLALITLIQHAFADVERGNGITLHQAIALDDYCSEEAVAAARSQDTDTHWSEISRATLKNFESALSFLDELGSRYYLPVFMITAIEGHISLHTPFFKLTNLMGTLRKSDSAQATQNYGFNPEQVQAIAAFLRFVVGEHGEKAESQAELQVVWQWETYASELGLPSGSTSVGDNLT